MLVQYEAGSTYVEVLVAENQYERRDILLGLSDGITVEVLDGIAEGDAIKIWNQPQY